MDLKGIKESPLGLKIVIRYCFCQVGNDLQDQDEIRDLALAMLPKGVRFYSYVFD